MKKMIFFWLLVSCIGVAKAQYTLKATLKNKTTGEVLTGATIAEGKKTLPSSKDNSSISINKLKPGNHKLSFSYIGYQAFDTTITIPQTEALAIYLLPEEKALEEVTVVSSTRTNQRIENSPLKVEVLGKEEMDEENTIKPANIASILGDVSGVQIQQSSAVSGNSNVRIQGLDGRYTQLVRDGMPLFDGFSGGFGIMQIPPLDLKQIELIKGSASTLYGGGAIGGLVNLISKRPSYEQDGIVTLNHSTLTESNFNTYLAKRNKIVGYNVFAGITHQDAVDVNKDGFSDVPKLDAVVVHPRFFYYPSSNTTIALGYTGTFETRRGGDMQLIKGTADAVHQYFEENKTNRHTGDFVVEQNLGGGKKLEFKNSISSFTRNILTNTHFFKGNQFNYFSELSLFIPKEKYSWVMGVNAVGDKFTIKPSDPVLLNNFDNNTIGAFAQFTGKLFKETTLEAGLRADHHTQYGDFVLPRLALFHRFNEHWATRLGIGLGYKTPNALTVQNKDYNIENILPLPANIAAEKSFGYNAEVNYKKKFDGHSSIFINQAFFLTQINNPVVATELANGNVVFNNAGSNVTSKGFDTYVKLSLEDWELYAGYTFTIAERNYLPVNKFVTITPKNRFAFVAMYEIENNWRFGLEGSYTGPQHREEDYTKTPAYMFMALLIEKKFGQRITLVANCENLLDYRQSKEEALYTGPVSNPVFKSLWAPIDGRVVNLSLRIKLFSIKPNK
ncbi:TonB-dependent receptor domain-containing protein [Parasediminibacterium sp. JCM 36343]|uniref:TonB-dependent receptor n=1 Tax=Parasediminibacterium sp. JCM 36343 TaxID=3374279 RepID=UPI0039791446